MTSSEHINIPCIGHLNSQELLENCDFSYVYCPKKGIYIPDFMDKIILDFWCWVSDLLSTIQRVSQPKKLYGVDTIFETNSTLIEAKQQLRQHLRKYCTFASDMIKQPTYQKAMIWVQGKLRERFRVLHEFDIDTSYIEYSDSIANLPGREVDIIFISFLMYRTQQHHVLLDILISKLSAGGSIYITDFSLLDRFPVIQEYNPQIISQATHEYTTLKITKK